MGRSVQQDHSCPAPLSAVLWEKAALLVTGAALAGTGVFSLFRLWSLDPTRDGDYPMLSESSLPLNAALAAAALLLLALPTILAYAARRKKIRNPFPRLTPRKIRTAAAVIIFALGVILGLFLRPDPRYDAGAIQRYAGGWLQGETSELLGLGYFTAHSYQIGYLLYSRAVQAIFGIRCVVPFTVLNSLWLALSALGLLRMIGKNDRGLLRTVQSAWVMLLCLPPLFSVTYQYGNLPALCCTVWSASLAGEALDDGSDGKRKNLRALGCAALISLGVILKPNTQIASVALAIVFLCSAFRSGLTRGQRIRQAVWAVMMVLLPILLRKAVYVLFGLSVGRAVGKGLPMTAYFAMGLQDSGRAPGWFNGFVEELWQTYGGDPDALAGAARNALTAQIKTLLGSPLRALRFFLMKLTSQWGECTFESQWVNRSAFNFADQPEFVRSLMAGPFADRLSLYMKGWTLVVYGGYAIEAFRSLFRKQRVWNPSALVLLLTLAGAMAYHLIGEAKSEYAMIYLYPIVALWALLPAGRSCQSTPNSL